MHRAKITLLRFIDNLQPSRNSKRESRDLRVEYYNLTLILIDPEKRVLFSDPLLREKKKETFVENA